MSNTTLEIGTVVQLRSGGPKMTVVHHTEDGKAWCLWFHEGVPGFRDTAVPHAALRPVHDDNAMVRLEHSELLRDLVLEAIDLDIGTGEITGTPVGTVADVRAALDELDNFI